jgi:hypothetical protein
MRFLADAHCAISYAKIVGHVVVREHTTAEKVKAGFAQATAWLAQIPSKHISMIQTRCLVKPVLW